RLGPRAVRAVERIGPYEHVLRMTPMADCTAVDVGDVPFRSRFSLESCHEDIEEFFAKVVSAGVVPLAVGGDHSISRAILRAVGVPAVIAKARAVVSGGPVYVSFDVDSLDPGFAPGTGTPEVGGLTPREVLELLRGLAGLDVIGGDVVEVAPQYDATSNTAHA